MPVGPCLYRIWFWEQGVSGRGLWDWLLLALDINPKEVIFSFHRASGPPGDLVLTQAVGLWFSSSAVGHQGFWFLIHSQVIENEEVGYYTISKRIISHTPLFDSLCIRLFSLSEILHSEWVLVKRIPWVLGKREQGYLKCMAKADSSWEIISAYWVFPSLTLIQDIVVSALN